VDILRVPPDHAIGGVTLPGAGRWRCTFTPRTSEIDQAAVTAAFDIRPA
jgi:hypothetical protein